MYRAIQRNKINTVLIMLVFLVLIGAISLIPSALYDNWTITIWALAGSLAYACIQYFLASSEALSMAGAQSITEADNPRLYRIVENLAISQGMPTPKIHIIDDPSPNAFATGRSPETASVAATTGLLELLNDAELEGVMAHELSHVKNYDIRVNMIVFGLVAAVSMLADIVMRMGLFGGNKSRNNSSGGPLLMIVGIVAALIAPLIAGLVKMAVSRQREYLADASGAMMTRYPEGLASALHKIRSVDRPLEKSSPSMSHMWLSDPSGSASFWQLFSTHPPTEERIRRLLKNSDRF